MSDAVSFYEHLKFYIDSISVGVYPWWDPSWSCGSPNEFFLRRIGAFNPFLLLILIPYKLGLNYWAAFSFFITFYFFLGMFGFYKLALKILKDNSLAVIAFVLLSFSSLSTRVFDSYIMMILTPTVWFFYFGFIFGCSGQRGALLGMVFCTMLLMTTYIPFYFIILVLSFLVFFALIYPKETLGFFSRLKDFVWHNPWLFLFCIVALLLSCLPGVTFFKSAAEGTFALPLRHFDATDAHMLSVKSDVTSYWAIPEELMYSSFYFSDLRLFDFAVFYIPVFGGIVLLLGLVAAVNRKILMFFLWGFFLFALGSPYLFALYSFLQKNVFFFKYFRNLHFFLWLAILPIAILFIVEQLRVFLRMIDENPQRKWLFFIYIIFVHAAAGAFFYWQRSFNFSTWISLVLSLLFFIVYLSRRLSARILCGLCFLAIVIQPLEAYKNLQSNAYKTIALLSYDKFPSQFEYVRGERKIVDAGLAGQTPAAVVKSNPIYFGTQWYNLLWNNIDSAIVENYTLGKFILYDRVSVFDEKKENFQIIAQALARNLNVAFVPVETSPEELKISNAASAANALIIEKDNLQFSVLDFNANRVKLRTNFSTRKFLVFNDCYYPGWRVFINKKEATLLRANIAFKGVWVQSGQQEIEFVFGNAWRFKFEPLLGIFYLSFLFLTFFFWKKDQSCDGVRNV